MDFKSLLVWTSKQDFVKEKIPFLKYTLIFLSISDFHK